MSDSERRPVTRCPQCGTMFRVSLAQLQAAAGEVRCGACLHTFNAIDFVVAPELLLIRPAQTSAPTSTTADMEQAIEQMLGDLDDEPIEDPESLEQSLEEALAAEGLGDLDVEQEVAPEASDQDNALSLEAMLDSASGTTLLDKEMVTDTLSTKDVPDNTQDVSEEATSLDPTEERASVASEEPCVTDAEIEVADVSGTNDWIDEHPEPLTSAEPFLTSTEAHISEAFSTSPDDRHEEPSDSLSEDDALFNDVAAAPLSEDEHGHSDDVRDENTTVPEADNSPLSDTKASDPALAILMEDLELIPDNAPETDITDDTPANASASSSPWLTIGIVVMALLLAGQWLRHTWPKWERQPEHRSWMQAICDVVGCSLPPLVDVEKMVVLNHVLTQRAEHKKQWRFDLQLRNDAPFAQPFPDIELTVLDRDGQVLAARRFTPKEYAPAAPRLLPSGQTAHIGFDLAIALPDVPSYEIRLTQARQ